MKKFKKVITSLLAICMLCAVALPADAVDSDVQMSEFAGGTKPCMLIESFEDGREDVIHEFDVAIPANATKEMESALVAAEVNRITGVTGANAYRAGTSPYGVNYPGNVFLCENGPFQLASMPVTLRVGRGQLDANYSVIYVTFADMRPGANASTFHIEIGNDNYTGGTVSKSQSIVISTDGTTTIWMRHGEVNGQGTLRLRSGDNITVWAALEQGSMFVNDVVASLS